MELVSVFLRMVFALGVSTLPADLWGAVPGNDAWTGTWSQAPEAMTDRLIGMIGEATMMTDLPVTIPSDRLPGFLNCSGLWGICDLYRIRRVSVSFYDSSVY